jgi:hypothetical protein
MVNIETIINPGVGFGTIKFGMSTKDVESRLGKPESFENPNEDGSIVYEYESIGINYLMFDEETNFQLDNIELNKKSNAILWNSKLFELTFDDIEALFKSKGYVLKYEDIVKDFNSEEVWEISYSIDSLGVFFYFSNSKQLKEINLRVLFNEDDEIIWPK